MIKQMAATILAGLVSHPEQSRTERQLVEDSVRLARLVMSEVEATEGAADGPRYNEGAWC